MVWDDMENSGRGELAEESCLTFLFEKTDLIQ